MSEPGRPALSPWRRVLLVCGWTIGVAAPIWLVSALAVDDSAADMIGYASMPFGMVVGITRGARRSRRR